MFLCSASSPSYSYTTYDAGGIGDTGSNSKPFIYDFDNGAALPAALPNLTCSMIQEVLKQ